MSPTLFAINPESKNIYAENGRSSDLLPLLNAFPNNQWQKCCSKHFLEHTAAGTVPEFDRIPFYRFNDDCFDTKIVRKSTKNNSFVL